ncbi:MAG: hypothetical protein RQ866_02245 [Bacteroidales bacterium]|nr:hypothetical protein [Bacteroidales bacterium]
MFYEPIDISSPYYKRDFLFFAILAEVVKEHGKELFEEYLSGKANNRTEEADRPDNGH